MNHLERYKVVIASTLKRKSTSDEGPYKQLKLWESKKSVDEAILNFVIKGLHPLSIVQQQGFRKPCASPATGCGCNVPRHHEKQSYKSNTGDEEQSEGCYQ